ncbi:glycosyltransferase family 2 protein [Adlercreutzia sp. ZJ141]|uniref:glycosyltransferase family 2 protein n=1 Tax=Adlercreutzia sp. ZJ141 TaxID=2709406 RepID=UPI0013EAFE6E|nr:glycosyltransferase family 2 protein [Adlercreutzia sp. ZJ141]
MEDAPVREKPVLYIVVPCYNEESVLPVTARLFLLELEYLVSTGKISTGSKICFVNDGSSDSTWSIICSLSSSDVRYVGLSLSRNRGHQNALLAGLMEVRGKCDICVSMDCDGQDDISACRRMVDEYLSGSDVVYGVRSKRETDTTFKRLTAQGFYRLLELMGVEIVYNHADYRLLSSRALDGLAEFGEVNLFLRGLVPLVGFTSSTVEYERSERIAGESHYPLSKMLGLAFDGITSLSIKPIRTLSFAGVLFSVLGLVGFIWAVVAFFTGQAISGWASTVCFVCFFGGLQLFALGIIGEYVGKIYLEVKNRPRYIIAERTGEL